MSKIPVGRTIGRSYGFAFGDFLPLLGVLWLPLLLSGVAGYFILLPIYQHLPDMLDAISRNPNGSRTVPPEIFETFRWSGLFNLFALAMLAVIAVGVTKEALGLRKGPRFVYLAFGADEFRIIGGYILVFALMIAGAIALEIVAAILAIVGAAVFASGTAGHLDPKAAGSGVHLAILLVGLLVVLVEFAFAYVYVRLSYLIVPVTVAEHRFGVWRSWELTKGNFWRIFAVTLAILLPIMIIEFVAMAFAFGSSLVGILSAMQKSPADMVHQMAQFMRGIGMVLPYAWGIGFIFSPIIYGLWLAPAAFAYRALVPAVSEAGAAPMMAAHP
jgi:hypothetical protein